MANKNNVFVCEHGAAKSVVASAWFNKLAAKNGLDIRSTHPDFEYGTNTVAGLANDGLHPVESVPQKISLEEVQSAQHIVTFCELPQEYKNIATTESWTEVPDISDGYKSARDAIVEHVEKLIHKLNHDAR
jgi:arsenate reductase